MPVGPEKEKAIELAVSSIEKEFGKGSIMRLGNEEALVKDVQAVSTGSVSLDIALGVGGLPRGRVIEIFGPESSGKTTLALHAIAEAQKKGGIAAFIDAEHALDVGYARKLGVRTDDLLISQPDTGEQALEIAETLVRSRRRRRAGDRLGRRAGAQGRARGRDGRRPHGRAGAPHEPGAAQAHRHHLQVLDHRHLHQPDPDEDRRDVRKPRDHHRRQRAQVLRDPAARHPPHRRHQGRRAGHRQPHPGQGGEEQGRSALQGGGVRHHVRPGDQPRGRRPRSRPPTTTSSRRAAPGSASAASGSARAASRPRPSSASTPRSSSRSRGSCSRSTGSGAARSRSPRRRTSRTRKRRRSTQRAGKAHLF